MKRFLAHWPAALGLVMSVDNLIDPRPLPIAVMLVLPLGYLLIGGLRRTLRPRRVLLAQLGGLAGYLVLVGAALLADPVTAQVLVGLGWIAHAGWDAWHYRRRMVVPRGFAEWCLVVDLVIGVTVIVAIFLR
jgi:hypothetical protein